jgi:hypothetical protein
MIFGGAVAPADRTQPGHRFCDELAFVMEESVVGFIEHVIGALLGALIRALKAVFISQAQLDEKRGHLRIECWEAQEEIQAVAEKRTGLEDAFETLDQRVRVAKARGKTHSQALDSCEVAIGESSAHAAARETPFLQRWGEVRRIKKAQKDLKAQRAKLPGHARAFDFWTRAANAARETFDRFPVSAEETVVDEPATKGKAKEKTRSGG